MAIVNGDWQNTRWGRRLSVAALLITLLGGIPTGLWYVTHLRDGLAPINSPLRSPTPEYFDPHDLTKYLKWGIDAATAGRVAALLRTENRLGDARELLLELRSRTATREAIDFLNGLITATYYGQERHREGLEFLGDITARLPPNDFRYRFQFHAHLRAVVGREGIDEAEKLVREMRRRFRRVEYSRVWLGIPLANMEALYRGDDVRASGPPPLQDADRVYLSRLVEEIPDDTFIDHALYALHRYEPLIRTRKGSLLRAPALQLWVYEAVDCELTPMVCRPADAQQRLSRLEAEFPSLTMETRIHAGGNLARAGLVQEAEWIGCNGRSDCFGQRETILDAAMGTHAARAEDVVRWLARRDPPLLTRRLDDVIRAFDHSVESARTRDYAGMQGVLARCLHEMSLYGVVPTPQFTDRLDAFVRLERTSTADGAEALFERGLAEANAARLGGSFQFANVMRGNAAETFAQVEQLEPSSELGAKASYLRAAALHRMQNYDAASAELDHFLMTYTNSPLCDDMLTEHGVYLLEAGAEQSLIEGVFEDVARRFPSQNAADNALTWLATSQIRRCRFADALTMFERIESQFPTNRLGIQARQQISALIPIVQTRALRNAIHGLTISDGYWGVYLAEVAKGSAGEAAELTAGDSILAVGGESVRDRAEYYAALRRYSANSNAVITIKAGNRGRDVIAVVAPSEYYATTPAGFRGTCSD